MRPAWLLIPAPPAAPPLLLSGSLGARGASTLAARHRLAFPEKPLPVLPLLEPLALPRAIRAFFRRVNDECFPICDQALTTDHLPTLLGWLETLPIGLYGLDHCHEGAEGYPEPFALALSLSLVEWQDPSEATWWLEEYGHLALPPELSISCLVETLAEMALAPPLDGLGSDKAIKRQSDRANGKNEESSSALSLYRFTVLPLCRAHWRTLFADEYNLRPGGAT